MPGQRTEETQRVGRARFRRYVRRAVDSLPERFRDALDNVSLVVEQRPGPDDRRSASGEGALYGIYRGIPLTERAHGYQQAAPDIIAIFRLPLLRDFGATRRLQREIRLTVLHELGHYFGLEEERVSHL